MEFLFPHRIARISYLLRTLAICGVTALLSTQGGESSRGVGTGHSVTFVFGTLVLAFYWVFFVIVPRCRDLAMSAWCALLAIVPGIGLFFSGYLTWGKTKIRRDWPENAGSSAGENRVCSPPDSSPAAGAGGRSAALHRLETLRDKGVITDGQFERIKARDRL